MFSKFLTILTTVGSSFDPVSFCYMLDKMFIFTVINVPSYYLLGSHIPFIFTFISALSRKTESSTDAPVIVTLRIIRGTLSHESM